MNLGCWLLKDYILIDRNFSYIESWQTPQTCKSELKLPLASSILLPWILLYPLWRICLAVLSKSKMNVSINRNLRFCCFVRDTKVAIIAAKIQFGSSQCMWLLNSKLNWIYTFSLIARITFLHTFNLTNCIFTHKLFLRITCMWPQSKKLKIWI